MATVKWVDDYFDNGERTVLTSAELSVDGLQVFGRHYVTKAIPALNSHYHENCFEFTYISKGNSTFWVDNHEYKLSGGDVFFTFPDEVHSTGSVPLSVNEMYWFQLDVSNFRHFLFLGNDWAKELIQRLRSIQSRVIKTDNTEMKSLIKGCFSLFNSRQHDQRYEATCLLLVFLHKLLKYDKEVQFKYTPDIAKAMDYIIANLYEEISLDYLACLSGLSLSRFKQKFKEQIGVTPREFINFRKVEIAKNMLLLGQPVTSIAMELGFATSNYFAVVFRRFTTYSPTEYINLYSDLPKIEL